MLLGRRSECEALDRLIEQARAGHSGVLVLTGEAGIGKSALLEYALERAVGFRIARVAAIESEMELAFAALHQLCAPMLSVIERLPAPQRVALSAAFGLSSQSAPDRFFVSLAALSLLSDAAANRPLLCLVDDAQWLDHSSAQTLAFVARRLQAESVAVLLAMREPIQIFDSLPELTLGGLSDAEARELLATVVPGRLDESVRDRIIAEAEGNPLALLELPRGLTLAELAGGFGVPETLPLADRIRRRFLQRLDPLPADTRTLLLIAAAEPVGDPTLLWGAAPQLGIGLHASAPAETAGLLQVGGRATFRHPLVRSVIYNSAALAERQRVHWALAEATDAVADPDKRAWHQAQATPGTDDLVANELEQSAQRARSRGGIAAAAAFLTRAAALTTDPTRKVERVLAAIRLNLDAGAHHEVETLLQSIETASLDHLQHARFDRFRAELDFYHTRGNNAPALLLQAARRLEPLDVSMARRSYLEAFEAAIFAGRLAESVGPAEVAKAVRAGPQVTVSPRPFDLLLDGLAIQFTVGYTQAVPILKQALDALRAEPNLRWLSLACRVCTELWDDEAMHVLANRHVELARESGALTVLPLALDYLGAVRCFEGDIDKARALIDEAAEISSATGNPRVPYARLTLAAYRGNEQEMAETVERSREEATLRGEGRTIGIINFTTALLHVGLGRYGTALVAAQETAESGELVYTTQVLPELIEAAARSGETEVAADALQRLSERTSVTATAWALGVEAWGRALLSEGESAEASYLEAIELLGRTRMAIHLARAHLLYGEWLRRENRRIEAREQLRTAHEMFLSMAAEGFAGRAERELLATGEHARKRSVETAEQLTAQETQIANMARDGLSNHEIGTQLFISPRTVEYHLHKVFAKLGTTSRNQLHRALSKVN